MTDNWGEKEREVAEARGQAKGLRRELLPPPLLLLLAKGLCGFPRITLLPDLIVRHC